MLDSLICRGADTRPGARMVLEGGGDASHRGGGCHRGGHDGRKRRAANTGGESKILRQGQTKSHNDF